MGLHWSFDGIFFASIDLEANQEEMTTMSETLVRELSDGEELVIEGISSRAMSRYVSDDPRDRALETRRLAFDQSSFKESTQW